MSDGQTSQTPLRHSATEQGSSLYRPSNETGTEEALLGYWMDTAKRMARHVTHDFNNLIAVVRGYAAALQGSPPLDQDTKELAGFIDAAGSDLAKLTERMAIFAEGREINRTRLNLNTVVQEFLNQCDGAILEGVDVASPGRSDTRRDWRFGPHQPILPQPVAERH